MMHLGQRKRNPALQMIQKRMRGVREKMRRRRGKTIMELFNFKQIIFD